MKRRSFESQISDKCVHFNGLQNDNCGAGVAYDVLDQGHRVPYRAALPCFKPEPGGCAQCHCEHLRFPTAAETKAELDSINKAMRKMMVANALVAPIRKEHKGKNWQGVLVCPTCNGSLHVSHATNGHVRVRCETAGCTSWIE